MFQQKAQPSEVERFFPDIVENQCSYQWTKHGQVDFIVGSINALIELKGTNGEVAERAYIFMECRGNSNILPKPKKTLRTIQKSTDCMGVRINGLHNGKINDFNVFAIKPEWVEVKSGPKDKTLILEWEWERMGPGTGSKFEVTNGKTFSWQLTSSLTGNVYKGLVNCR
jgi:hypothetical protein